MRRREVGHTHGEEKDNQGAALPEVHGEQALAQAGADAEALLQNKQDSKDTGNDEKRNASAALPRPGDAAEVHGQDDGNDAANRQDRADVIDAASSLQQRDARQRLEIRQHEEVHGRTDSADQQVQVERPAPRSCAVTQGAADHRTQHGADTPDEARETQVARTLGVGCGDGKKCQKTEVHAAAADARNGTADDEGLDGGSAAAQRRGAHKDCGAANVELLGRERPVGLGPGERAGGGTQSKGNGEPGNEIDAVKGQDDLGLDVGDDSVVEGVEEQR